MESGSIAKARFWGFLRILNGQPSDLYHVCETMSWIRFYGCYLLMLTLLMEFGAVQAQVPEQDCINAINLCSPSFTQTNAYAGIGQVVDVPLGSSCLQGGETNSVWYTFTVAQDGPLTFQLTPVNAQDDYDFTLYLLGEQGCSAIADGTLSPVRCNYSSAVGATGLMAGAGGDSEGSSGPNQCSPVTVVAGQTYVLLVSNFTASQGGYTINFGGGATMGDQVAAAIDSVDLRLSCSPRRIDLWLTDPVLCSSISSDGSEITVTGPSGVTVTSVVSALNCAQNQGYTTRIRIMLAAQVTVFGTYTITIGNGSDGNTWTDACGNALAAGSTASFTITESGPDVNVTSIVPSYCGQGIGSADSEVLGGTAPYSYLWSGTPTQTTPNATGLLPGNYTLRVTDVNGCREIVSFTIANNSPITLTTALVNGVSCSGGADGSATVSVIGGQPPYTYSWNSNPMQTTQTATGLPAGNRIVTVTDNTGCVTTSTRNITQPPPINVTITPTLPDCGVSNGELTAAASGGAGALAFTWGTQPAQNTATITGLYAGIYPLTVTDGNGCSVIRQVNLINNFAPDAGISASTPDCGQLTGSATVSVSSGVPPFNYDWSSVPQQFTATASGLAQGDYFVVVTDQTGCIQIVNVKIDSISPPQLQMSLTHSDCGLNNGEAQAIVTEGIGPYQFSWAEFPAVSAGSLTELPSGSYSLTVTDSIGCVTEHSFTVDMLPPMSSIIFSPVCDGSEMLLTAETTSGATGFSWSFADGTSLSGQSVGHTFPSAGSHQVILSLSGGCMDDTAMTQVDVWPLPSAAFTYAPDIPTSRRPVEFQYTGSEAQQWLWDFGNGQTSTGQNPLHTYNTEGTYTVALSVTDANGCIDTVSVLLDLLADPILLLPSAFVPEGVNQTWYAKGLGIDAMEIHVFSRAGLELWSCNDEAGCLITGWDGTYAGLPVPQGVYGYRVNARFYDERVWEAVGTVTLIR
jgi:hypothetical protein